METKKPPIILILGMHRSGTSLVAQLIAKWGVYSGEDLMPANEYNKDGYWEYNPLVSLHEKMLAYTHNTWYAPSNEINTTKLINTFSEEAHELVKKMDNSNKPWFWKDPRMALFLPFWNEILKSRKVYYIIPFRKPSSVALSLQKRDNIPESIALDIWELYNFKIIDYIHSKKDYLLVNYDTLLENQLDCSLKIHSFISNNISSIEKYNSNSIKEIIKPEYRTVNSEKEFPIENEQQKLYNLLISNKSIKKQNLNNSRFTLLQDYLTIYRKSVLYSEGKLFSQLFFKKDKKDEYSEKNSFKQSYTNSKKVVFENSILSESYSLRFDPLNTWASIKLFKVETFMDETLVNSYTEFTTNASEYLDGSYFFTTHDPIVEFIIDGTIPFNKVIVHLDYVMIGAECKHFFADNIGLFIKNLLPEKNNQLGNNTFSAVKQNLNGIISELNKELANAHNSLLLSEENLKLKQNELFYQEKELIELKEAHSKKIDTLNEEINNVVNDQNISKLKLAENEKLISSNTNLIDHLENEKKLILKQIDDLKLELNLEKENSVDNEKKIQELSKEQFEKEKTISNLNTQLERKHQIVLSYENKIKSLDDKINTTKNQIVSFQQEIQQYKTSINAYKVLIDEKEKIINNNKVEKKNSKIQYENLRKTSLKNEIKIGELKNSVLENEKLINILKSDNKKYEFTNEQLHNTIIENEKKISKLEAYASENSTLINDLRTENENSELLIAQLQKTLNENENKISKLEASASEKENYIKILKSDIKSSESQNEKLQKTIVLNEKKISKLEAYASKNNTLINDLRTEKENLTILNEKLRNTIQENEKRISKIDYKIERKHELLKKREEKIKLLEDIISKMKFQVDDFQNEIQQFEINISTLQASIKEKEEQIREAKIDKKNSENQNIESSRTIIEKEKRISSLQILIVSKENEINNINRNIDKLSNKVYDLQRLLTEKEMKMKDTNKQIEKLKNELSLLDNLLKVRDKDILNQKLELFKMRCNYYYKIAEEIAESNNKKIWPTKSILRKNYKNKLTSEILMLKESDLFDSEYYQSRYLDDNQKTSPEEHYLIIGAFKGNNPSTKFNTLAYLEANPDVFEGGLNPLVHYIKYGLNENREVKEINTNEKKIEKAIEKTDEKITVKPPLHAGKKESPENKNPKLTIEEELLLIEKSEYFSEKYYLDNNPDVKAQENVKAIIHFYFNGWKEFRNPSSKFDINYYINEYKEHIEENQNPLIHFLTEGKLKGFVPKIIIKNNRLMGEEFEDLNENTQLFSKVKAIAFYLPQFHPIEENNKWWGKGFTEWYNVTKAKPLFKNHYQPHLPVDLGFYDLRIPEVMEQQIELAKSAGIHAFCFYYYWFGGKRLLEKPLDMFLKNKDWDINYCVCWANENWTRRWDGRNDDILIGQNHSPEDDINFLKDIKKYIDDERYIRINGKPLVIIYNPALFPSIEKSIKRWKEYCNSNKIEIPFFAMVQTFGQTDPNKFGFDAAIEFPPHGNTFNEVEIENIENFNGKVFSAELSKNFDSEPKPYEWFRGVFLNWDNTARKNRNAHIYLNNSPENYRNWLNKACDYSLANNPADNKFVFINAWNEWAEGTHLEPDQKFGYSYLNKTSEVLQLYADFRKLNKNSITFVSHDACMAGAQLVFKDIVEWFANKTSYGINIICVSGGELVSVFEKLAPTLVLSEIDTKDQEEKKDIIKQFMGENNKLIYLNSVASGSVIKLFKSFNKPLITHFHELQKSIEVYASDVIDDVISDSDHFIACSNAVNDNLVSTYKLKQLKVSMVHAFVKNKMEKELKLDSKKDLRNSLDLPIDKKIIFGAGLGLFWRKGADLFIDIGIEIQKLRNEDDFILVWLGDGFVDGDVKKYGKWEEHEARIKQNGLENIVTFLGRKNNVREYFSSGDIFILPSREDPFPLVCLEAADSFLPVLCFEKAGGMPEFVEQDAGFVIPFEDTKEMANKINYLLDNDGERLKMGKAAHKKFVDRHSTKVAMPKLMEVIYKKSKVKPLISIIVPNYNYDRYLQKRLDTIYNQTFQDFEVILLDDKSTDDSLVILKEYEKKPNTKLIINDKNSGSVFHQWQKGVRLARGTYIWIAESDDFSELNFLEKLVPKFSDNDVSLVYCNSNSVDENDIVTSDFYTINKYYEGLGYDSSKWQKNYINDGKNEIENVLAIKNTIPNSSCALFKRESFLKMDIKEIEELSCSHDWLTYINVIKEGKIGFVSECLNFHRRHDQSVIAVNAKDYKKTLQEYYKSHKYIIENFEIRSDIYDKSQSLIFDQLIGLWPDIEEKEIEKYYPKSPNLFVIQST
jgi:glycosyltransferase involved in cell wall biosynthesis